MPGSYAGSPTYHANITPPSDGDPRTAASVRTPLQQLADRATWLKAFFDESGVKKVRNVVQVSDLKALTGMADKEVAWVAAMAAPYIYLASSIAAADDIFVVQPNSGGGRWVHPGYTIYLLRGAANGFASLNASTKVPDAQIKNAIADVQTYQRAGDATDGDLYGASVTGTSFADLFGSPPVTLANCSVGDVLHIDAAIQIRQTCVAATHNGMVQLAVRQGAGAFSGVTGSTRRLFANATNDSSRYEYIRLAGRFVVSTGGMHDVTIEAKNDAGLSSPSIDLYGSGFIRVLRVAP
jgi:hypothetical protein